MPKRGSSGWRRLSWSLCLLGASACHSAGPAHGRAGASADSRRTDGSGLAAAATASAAASALGSAGPATAAAAASPLATHLTSPATPSPRLRVHYALAHHPERAELRRGTTRVLDLGQASDAQYTLGGWLAPAMERRTLDGASAELSKSGQLQLSVPLDAAVAHTLWLRARSFAPGVLQAKLAGHALPARSLSGMGWQSVSWRLSRGFVANGDNWLELEFQLPRRVAGALALDLLEARPAGSAEDSQPLQPMAAQHAQLTTEQLQVHAGTRVGYALQLPAGASLRGSVSAQRAGRLRVSAARDGSAPLLLASLPVGPGARSFDIDLSSLGGELARIDLEAEQTELVLDSPCVVTIDDGSEQRSSFRPARNAVVVLVDTLRPDRLTAYNPRTRVATPALGRWLPETAVMLDARAQENWTKPSVATLFTSLFPWQHQVYTDDAVLPQAAQTMAERLRASGFHTGAFVANGYVSEKFGFAQGFDDFRNYLHEGRPNVAQYVAADVLAWLDARPKGQPFFLYVHTVDPHVPYKPPPHFLSMYDPLPYDGPINFHGNHNLLEKIKAGTQPVSDRDREHLVALYDAEVSYHDAYLGVILDGLRARGLAHDTLVILTSDHGEEFWEHGSVGHGHTVYDELLHVPLIVHLPTAGSDGHAVHGDVGLVDVMPTLLEALGQTAPASLTGRSFLPLLLGEQPDAPRYTVSGFMQGWRTLTVGRFKLVAHGVSRTRLYDLARDPGEHVDLAADRPIAVRYARALLGLALDAQSPNSPAALPTETAPLDAATVAQLHALGYATASVH